MFRPLRIYLSLLPLLLLLFPLAAQDVAVDRDELTSVSDGSITFTNYVGPYEFTNSLDEIRGIGRALGQQIDVGKSSEARIPGKYRVLHIVHPEIPEGFDADVFILDDNAAVDHIHNLRAILAGYLETAYAYTSREAYLVAEFATYYNAVHRGDAALVQERYKDPVFHQLTPEKIGLDTHYSNWAGKTQMLIPLRGASQVLSQKTPLVDTAAIADEDVIEQMRDEEDLGLDSRRELVELQEKELAQDQAVLDEKQEEVEQNTKALEEEIEKIQERKQAGESLTSTEQQEQTKLEEQKAELEEEQAAINEQQAQLDERTEEMLQMRDDIAADENQLLNAEAAPQARTEPQQYDPEPQEQLLPLRPAWFLKVESPGDGVSFGRVVKVNLEGGDILTTSEASAVRGRTMLFLGDQIVVISGKDAPGSRVCLLALDKETLVAAQEGQDDIFAGSSLLLHESSIYAVSFSQGEWRLGKFDASLKRTSLSDVAVEPWTSISFDGSAVLVQGTDASIHHLSASNLREVARLE